MARESSIRRSRSGAVFLMLLLLLSRILVTMHDPDFQLEQEYHFWIFIAPYILLGALAYQYHLQTMHIDTIKRYRKETR